MKEYAVEPRVPDDRYVGARLRDLVVYVGRVAEVGRPARCYLDLSNEFVLMEVGKRGSGKSYSMGALLEGLSTVNKETTISKLEKPRGILLLDPLDVHWTALVPVKPDGPEEVRNQFNLLRAWPEVHVEQISVNVWMPAGKGTPYDHPSFREYFIPVSSFDIGDWGQLLRADTVLEPRGQLIYEIFTRVTDTGWRSSDRSYPAKADYSIQDLIDCLTRDIEINQGDNFAQNTIRSVLQPLIAYNRLPLFSQAAGTPLTDLLVAGTLSVLCLARLEPDLRTVLSAVIVKSMKKQRREASFLEKRLALEALEQDELSRLQAQLANYIPRAILALDEAQILLPADETSTVRKQLESFVLEGRNYGLSLWLATQRPSGAVSPAARSQVDTFLIHRLSVKEDIVGMLGSLQSDIPTKISYHRRELSFEDLIRSLETGQAVISSADTQASSNRAFIVNIRPRVTCHGGKAF